MYAAVPLFVQYVKFCGEKVTKTGEANVTIMVLLSPAYMAFIATLPGMLPAIELMATPFAFVVVTLVESLYFVLFSVKFTVAPLRG